MKEYALRLYFYPSPYGIDWASPRALAWTTLRNQINRVGRSIGHVHIEFCKYHPKNNSLLERSITGMRQLGKAEERKLLLLDNVGLGVLFHSFKGRIESTEEIIPEIEQRLKRGNISVLTFWVKKEAFERARLYLKEYLEKGCENHYGLANRPLHGEGGGCSAFGASFLDVIGVFTDSGLKREFEKNWTRTISVPSRLIQKTSLLKILFSGKAKKWADKNEENKSIFFWDPDLMHRWVVKTWHELQTGPTGRFKPHKIENAFAIECDLSDLKVPTESYWR